MSVTITPVITTHTTGTELGQAIHELDARQIDIDEFTRRLMAARLYTLCPVRPGLFVMSRRGGTAIVPVWSTLRALRHALGNYDWLARTGQDLVGRLPDGVGVLIDDGMPCPIALSSAVLRDHHSGP